MADKNDAIPMLHSDGLAIVEAIKKIRIGGNGKYTEEELETSRQDAVAEELAKYDDGDTAKY